MLKTEGHHAEHEVFSCLERGNCCDVPMINYCMPLGAANLGKALANMEQHREKSGYFRPTPQLLV